MFQFTRFASHAYEFSVRSPYGGVAPFGDLRINACSRLPVTYRNVLRPSSPLSAKASTKCPFHTLLYSLPHSEHNTHRAEAYFKLQRFFSTTSEHIPYPAFGTRPTPKRAWTKTCPYRKTYSQCRKSMPQTGTNLRHNNDGKELRCLKHRNLYWRSNLPAHTIK